MNEESGLEQEAKAIVLHAFRNGPIEDVHAGKACPTCHGRKGISRITDWEMKSIMKTAVDRVYLLLKLRDERPEVYRRLVRVAAPQVSKWDPPDASAGL